MSATDPEQTRAPADQQARDDFFEHVRESAFPCLGGQAAVHQGTCDFRLYEGLPESPAVSSLASHLREFVNRFSEPRSHFAVLAAADRRVRLGSEEDFEAYLWLILQTLHEMDDRTWDGRYSTDPRDSSFKFSFAGRAFYVVGLSPVASRTARRTNLPIIIFNPVWQFERLRELGQLDALIERIRQRDQALQGDINPNLRFEGVLSDALQYSGRAVTETWRCPFNFKAPKVSGRRIYLHEASLTKLAKQGELVAHRVYTVLAAIRSLKIIKHHVEQATELGLLSAVRKAEVDETLGTPLLEEVTGFLRVLGHRPRDPKARAAFRPVLLPTESITATCSESGYLTFATSPDAARVMFEDHVPLRHLRRELAGGKGPPDLTIVNGQVLALVDPAIGVGETVGSRYATAIQSASVSPESLAKLENDATHKVRDVVNERLAKIVATTSDESSVLQSLLDSSPR